MSPTPSASSVPSPTADFSDPDHLVPASVIPRWIGYSIFDGQQPVGGDRVGDAGRLDRDLEVLELEPLHQLDELDGGLDERLDRSWALQLVEVLGQRPGVDADPHRDARRGRPLRDLGDLVGAADVARVEPDAVRAGVDRLQRQRVVEVDVGDHRDRRLGDDRLQRLDVGLARHGDPDEVRARLGDPRICSMVAARFAVSVLVIVWTTTGAPPPIGTSLTHI